MTVQALPSLDSTQPLDANIFAFFKGLNDKDVNGILSTDLPTGLPAGFYRICSINSSANHQPVLVSNAQRGSSDDCSYVSHCRRAFLPFALFLTLTGNALTFSGCSLPSAKTMVATTTTTVATTETTMVNTRTIAMWNTCNDSASCSGSPSPPSMTYNRLTTISPSTGITIECDALDVKCHFVA